MWCLVSVMFMLQEEFELFPLSEMGDGEVTGPREVTCTGNHRLLDDVHSWCGSTQGVIKVYENFAGYDTYTIYSDGQMVSQVSVEEVAQSP